MKRTVTMVVLAAVGVLVACNNNEGTEVRPSGAMDYRYAIPDMTSDIMGRDIEFQDFNRRGVVAFVWEGDVPESIQAEAAAYFPRNIVVFSVDRGTFVDGRIESGLVRLDGEAVPGFEAPGRAAFSFVPNEALPDGWYVAATDLREWMSSYPARLETTPTQHYEGGRSYLRFQVGSEPTWTDTRVANGYHGDAGDGCLVIPYVANPAVDLATAFTLTVNGAPDPSCSPYAILEMNEVGWVCPEYPVGTSISVSLSPASSIRSVDPDRVHDFEVEAESFVQTQMVALDARFGILALEDAR